MHGTPGTHSTVNGTTGTPHTAGMSPIFVSPAQAAVVLGLSRREIYRLMDADDIESVEKGRRRLIVVESLHDFARRLREEAAARRKKAA